MLILGTSPYMQAGLPKQILDPFVRATKAYWWHVGVGAEALAQRQTGPGGLVELMQRKVGQSSGEVVEHKRPFHSACHTILHQRRP